ncbi:MAG: L-aspartate oxidase [Elusimicrobia bacterium]|nr:L-aspartate oxidase [Elusimicrobiota bacterium]
MAHHISDYLVIGSGIAGLSFAIKASQTGSVTLITKRRLADAATSYAQGGIAAVSDPEDSTERHISDTLSAGAGLCSQDVVSYVIEHAPARMQDLVDWGMRFDAERGLEAGHTFRRVFHAGDFTGREIEDVLIKKISQQKNIAVFENHIAVDLITTGKINRRFAGADERCWGAYVLDINGNTIQTFLAKTVVLATGGAGKVYLYTSSPDVSTGDGMAMAYRCGATMANMEFVQFHPTCLFHPQAKSFLISEAVRGEGAILRLKNGQPFMHKYHPMKELAPRDIVARAIDQELKSSGEDFVYLDITAKGEKFLTARFPNIYSTCLKYGIDMAKDFIPVVPAAHYFCGGVKTTLSGETSIRHLFAIGETACTGMHGANRLASNSLLEALVCADTAVTRARELVAAPCSFPDIPVWDSGNARDSDESVVVSQNWEEIRHFMGNYVGIVRSTKRLERAARRIELLQQEISEYYWNFIITSDLIELRNIATVAELVIHGAQQRRESRGLHYTLDFPASSAHPADTIIRRFPTV